MFLGCALYAGGIWKGDVLIADLEELETMNASEIYSKRLNAKEVIFPKLGDSFFSNRRWTNQNPWRRSGTENIHLGTASTNSRREQYWLSWRIRRVSSTTSIQDSFPDAGEAINDFWSMSGSFIFGHHVEPRVKLYSPRIIPYSTKIHWRIQNYSHEFGCQAREAHWWLLEYRWISKLVWSLDRFHTIYAVGRKNSWRIHVVRGRLTTKQLTYRPDHLWPELWKSMGKHAKLREKQKWSNEKIHLENARKLRGIYFIDPEDTEFKATIKNARKKLETSVALALPCKIMKNCGSDASDKTKTICVHSGSWWIHKNAYGKFDTASSSRPYCRKRWKFITALQFGSQVSSYASSYENSSSKSSSGQGMG